MIDGGGDAGNSMRHGAGRRHAFKTFGKFLGDERRGEIACPPARMLHDRGKERDVVANTLDGEGIERFGLGVDRRNPRLGVGDELGDHRIVI